MNQPQQDICVDLDGTLIHSDLLLETFLLLLKRNPLYLLLVPMWLLRGKAVLKAEIASRVQLDPAALPYNTALLTWMAARKAEGHRLWLCTASDQRLARQVAEHVGLFEGTMASTDGFNLSGGNKAVRLVERFGERGFAYCGNHKVDLAIWRVAASAIVVNGTPALETAARQLCPVTLTIPHQRRFWPSVIKAVRVHQWAKNALVFVPVLTAHQTSQASTLGNAALAFLAFGLCASSAYLLNDMLDLAADRLHPRKSRRPFASGQLSLLFGLLATPLLIAAAAALSLLLPPSFSVVLLLYFVTTLLYSFSLKRVVVLDVLTLAGLYTVRIVAGAAATGIELSFWLLLFSVFLFLSLALVKRYAELHAMRAAGKASAVGRGYRLEDLAIVPSLGSAAGYISVLVLALYINSPAVNALYRHPQWMWGLCLLALYWISRVWVITLRGDMHDDPLVFALRDGQSIAVGVLGLGVVLAAA